MLFRKRPVEYEFVKRKSSFGPNLLAILLSSAAALFLYIDYQGAIRPVASIPGQLGEVASLEDELNNAVNEQIAESAITEDDQQSSDSNLAEADLASEEVVETEAADQVAVVDVQQADSNEEPVVEEESPSKLANRQVIEFLEQTDSQLAKVDTYTATFIKQERVGTKLLKKQKMSAKFAHSPQSVYFKWLTFEKGREVLYKEGSYDNKMLVRKGGFSGRFLPTLKLDIDSSLVKRENRYTIKMAGLRPMITKALDYRRADLEAASGVHCQQMEDTEVEGVMCMVFEFKYDNESVSKAAAEYRRSLIYINKKSETLLGVRNYGWMEGDSDEDTLLEYYVYTNVDLEQRLADEDFNRFNKKYRLK